MPLGADTAAPVLWHRTARRPAPMGSAPLPAAPAPLTPDLWDHEATADLRVRIGGRLLALHSPLVARCRALFREPAGWEGACDGSPPREDGELSEGPAPCPSAHSVSCAGLTNPYLSDGALVSYIRRSCYGWDAKPEPPWSVSFACADFLCDEAGREAAWAQGVARVQAEPTAAAALDLVAFLSWYDDRMPEGAAALPSFLPPAPPSGWASAAEEVVRGLGSTAELERATSCRVLGFLLAAEVVGGRPRGEDKDAAPSDEDDAAPPSVPWGPALDPFAPWLDDRSGPGPAGPYLVPPPAAAALTPSWRVEGPATFWGRAWAALRGGLPEDPDCPGRPLFLGEDMRIGAGDWMHVALMSLRPRALGCRSFRHFVRRFYGAHTAPEIRVYFFGGTPIADAGAYAAAFVAGLPGARRLHSYATSRVVAGTYVTLAVQLMMAPDGRPVSLVAARREDAGPVPEPWAYFAAHAWPVSRGWLGPGGPRALPSMVEALRTRAMLPYGLVAPASVAEHGGRLFGVLESAFENGRPRRAELTGSLGRALAESVRPYVEGGFPLPPWHVVYRGGRGGGGR